jgi:2-polyprenyl-6-methoxyphenol hydroxylase-like FAD-dependent oxidoreductase
MSRTTHHHAVVVGASMAGLFTARVLADHFTRVTVLDRDQLLTSPDPRKGVPQGRHAHALLAAGEQVLTRLFPGIVEELVADGAVLMDFNDGRWFQSGGYRAPIASQRAAISASRPLLEAHLRRHVAARPNVQMLSGVSVDGLLYDGHRVRGVQVCEGDTLSGMTADLVVDCSGRSSRAVHWMEQLGYPKPEVVNVRCDMSYATKTLRRSAGDVDATFAVIIESPPDGSRAGILLPVEGDRWIVTLCDRFGAPAGDEASFHAFAQSLPAPQIREVLANAEPLTPIVTHRLMSSQRRRFEKLRKVPAGFVALGDSICSFNPLYGQGMSSAALQAMALAECLEHYDIGGDALPKRFYRQAAKVIAGPWKIAVGADFAYPQTTGPKPPGTDIVNRYIARVLLAAQVSPDVNEAMVHVQQLTAPPTSLFRPSIVRAVRKAARQAESHQAAAPSDAFALAGEPGRFSNQRETRGVEGSGGADARQHEVAQLAERD